MELKEGYYIRGVGNTYSYTNKDSICKVIGLLRNYPERTKNRDLYDIKVRIVKQGDKYQVGREYNVNSNYFIRV